MSKEIENLVLRISADARSLKAQLAGAENSVRSFGQRVASASVGIGQKMQAIGRSMSMYVTLPLAIGAAASIKAFADLDKAMVTSTAIMGNVSDAMKQRMEDQARQLSRETPTSAAKAAEAYYFLASAGMSAEQALASLSHVNKFAIAGQFDLATATDLLTDAQTALGLSMGTTAMQTAGLVRVGDVLAKANTLANATIEQFSVALTSKAGASLRMFNKDVEEGVAVLAVMADQGIKAELAGTSLDRMLRLLSQAALENATEFKTLGFSVFDGSGEMRNMADIVENLEQVLEGVDPELRAIKLSMMGFDARVQQTILPLIGFSEAIREKEAALNNAAGTMDEIVQNQLQAFNAEVKMMWNQIVDIASKIGEALIPAIRWMMREVQLAVDFWNGLSDTTQGVILVFLGFLAVVGPIVTMLGTMGVFLGTIAIGYNSVTTALATMAATSKLAAIAQWMLNAAQAAMPHLLILAGVAAFLAMAVAIGRALAGMNQLKAAQNERDRLDKKWKEMWEQTNIQEMNDILKLDDAKKKSEEFASSIKRVGNNIQGMNMRIQMQKKLLAEMEEEGAEYGKIGSEVYTAEVDNLNDMLDKKEMYVKHSKDLIEAERLHNQELQDKADIEAGRDVRADIIAEETEELAKLNKELEHQIATYGMTASEVQVYDAKMKGASEAQQEELRIIAEKNNAMEEELQRRKDAEKAIEDEKRAEEQLAETKKDMNQALDDEIAMFDMSNAEKKEYEALQAGLNEFDAAAIRIKAEKLEAMREEQKAEKEMEKVMKKGEQIKKSVMKPEEKFKAGQEELNDLLAKGAIDLETYTRAMEKLEKDTTVKVRFKVTGIEAVEAGSAEAVARLEEFRALTQDEQKIDFRKEGQAIKDKAEAEKAAAKAEKERLDAIAAAALEPHQPPRDASTFTGDFVDGKPPKTIMEEWMANNDPFANLETKPAPEIGNDAADNSNNLEEIKIATREMAGRTPVVIEEAAL